MKKICLVIPTLTGGGAERVMSILANELSKKSNVEVHLILLLNEEIFYRLDEKVIIHTPDFDYKNYPRWKFTLKILSYLRKNLKKIKPGYLLSFGGRYNSFVLLSTIGLNIKSYISDRSRPTIKYGFFQDKLNPYVYRLAHGIIAQTTLAKEVLSKKTKHKNIKVIGNPVKEYFDKDVPRENIILNVGRFIKTKQQELLIDAFIKINPENWQLWFVGDGKYFQNCKQKVSKSGYEDKIKFLGNQKDIGVYYQKSKIFAFTSISEGFPNSLAEAVYAGCASISFDCEAGPGDIIDHGKSGILIENNNLEEYSKELKKLTESDDLIKMYSENGRIKSREFSQDKIIDQYLSFIIHNR